MYRLARRRFQFWLRNPVDLKTNIEVLDIRRNPGVIRLLMRMRNDQKRGCCRWSFQICCHATTMDHNRCSERLVKVPCWKPAAVWR